jgi:branched-chain amino acid transport system ATP-binding protein
MSVGAARHQRPAVLKLLNVESAYGPIKAIRGVSLQVRRGEIATVLGSNGAGKSTILKTISRHHRSAQGQHRVQGRGHHGARPGLHRAAGPESHVPEGREVFPLLSVHDNLLMGAYTRKDRDGVARDMEAVYGYFPILKERATQDAGLLSGGQQQMLAISRAIMASPDLILLDEPSLGLSPKLTKEIFEIVVRINRERGTTILLVEQNANMALNAADYGYVLENGRIVMEDTCAKLREKEDIKEFYLGMKEDGVRGERAGRRRRPGDEPMSNLWDLTISSPRRHRHARGDTIPAMFWNAVPQRGDKVWMRQKELGIWRSWSWAQTGDAVRESPAACWPGLRAAATRPPSSPTPSSNGCWPTWPCCPAAACPTASTPPMPPAQVHYLCEDSRTSMLFVEDDEQLDKALEVRAPAAAAAQDRRVRHGRPARPRRPGRDEPGRTARAGPRATTRPPRCVMQRVPAGASRRPGHPGLHLGHHRQAQGRDAQPPGLVYTARGYNTLIARRTRDDERMCFLPLCHIAERMGGEYFSLYTGAKLNFVENPETVPENVREIAPTVFTAVPRVWEKFYSGVMIGLKEASWLQQAAYAWSSAWARASPTRCWRASRSRR